MSRIIQTKSRLGLVNHGGIWVEITAELEDGTGTYSYKVLRHDLSGGLEDKVPALTGTETLQELNGLTGVRIGTKVQAHYLADLAGVRRLIFSAPHESRSGLHAVRVAVATTSTVNLTTDKGTTSACSGTGCGDEEDTETCAVTVPATYDVWPLEVSTPSDANRVATGLTPTVRPEPTPWINPDDVDVGLWSGGSLGTWSTKTASAGGEACASATVAATWGTGWAYRDASGTYVLALVEAERELESDWGQNAVVSVVRSVITCTDSSGNEQLVYLTKDLHFRKGRLILDRDRCETQVAPLGC